MAYNSLKELSDKANQALSDFESISNFSIQQYPNNTINSRDSLVNKVRDQYDNYYATITPHIAYIQKKGVDFRALEQQARDAIKDIEATRQQQHEMQRKMQTEAEEILETIRRAAAEAGVSQHAIYFKDEASSHSKIAKVWLGATILIGMIGLAFALYSINFYSKAETVLSINQSIQLAVAKIVAFSILYYCLIWASRNYRAHRHNYVVNKHRQNALSTFQAFVNATEDDTTKNAVLIRSTEAIFSPGITGYLGKEAEPHGNITNFRDSKRSVRKTTLMNN